MPTEVYVIPPIEVTDESTGETITQTKYADDDRVDGFNSAMVPDFEKYKGPTTPAGQVYIVAVTGTQAVHDDIQADADTLTIGEGKKLKPGEFEKEMNTEFRPQTLSELKDALGEDYRDLSMSEWFDRLGIDTGN